MPEGVEREPYCIPLQYGSFFPDGFCVDCENLDVHLILNLQDTLNMIFENENDKAVLSRTMKAVHRF